MIASTTTTVIASGMKVSVSRLQHSRVPNSDYESEARLQVLEADLSKFRPGVLIAGRGGQGSSLTKFASRSGVRAAVNGGYFHLGPSRGENSSDDPVVVHGVGYQLLAARKGRVLALDSSGHPRSTDLSVTGSVKIAGLKLPLVGVNTDLAAAAGVRAWTEPDSPMLKVTWGATIGSGRVIRLWHNQIPAPPAVHQVVIGTTNGGQVKALSRVRVSARGSVNWKIVASDGGSVKEAVGIAHVLARRHAVVIPCNVQTEAYHPRTVVGWNSRQTRMWFATVQASGVDRDWFGGATTRQMAVILLARGADTVVAMDGGGSTELLARSADTQKFVRYDEPVTSFERSIPTGLGLFVR